jgi:predicted ABC-type ATPase
MPHLILIAGPNGAGKSTSAPGILHGALSVSQFVNADTIALATNRVSITIILPSDTNTIRCKTEYFQ